MRPAARRSVETHLVPPVVCDDCPLLCRSRCRDAGSELLLFLGVSECGCLERFCWPALEQKAWNLGYARIGGQIPLHRKIIPFRPDGWALSGGGFPTIEGNVAFLMKDVVLLAVSFYLLKQDLVRATITRSATPSDV